MRCFGVSEWKPAARFDRTKSGLAHPYQFEARGLDNVRFDCSVDLQQRT